MFAELYELVKEKGAAHLLLAVSGEGLLSVTVVPKGAGPEGLMVPMTLVGTPQELDEGFVEAVRSFQSARLSVKEQAEAAAMAVAAAAKAKQSQQRKGAEAARVERTEADAAEQGEGGSSAPASAARLPGRMNQSKAEEAAGTIQLF